MAFNHKFSSKRKLSMSIAAGVAAITLGIGGYAFANSGANSGASGSSTTAAAKVARSKRVNQAYPSRSVRSRRPLRPGRAQSSPEKRRIRPKCPKSARRGRLPGRHRQPCCAAERRHVQRPHNRLQLAAPRLCQRHLQCPWCPVDVRAFRTVVGNSVCVGLQHRTMRRVDRIETLDFASRVSGRAG